MKVVDFLGDEADYATLEAGLPASAPDAAHGLVLATWGIADPGAAAAHVLKNGGRISPEHVAVAAGVVDDLFLEETAAWLEKFPEGPYYDIPMDRLLSRMEEYPDLVPDLAARFTDPVLRQKWERKRMKTGEKSEAGE